MEFAVLTRGEQAPVEENFRAIALGALVTVGAGVFGLLCTVSLDQIAKNGTLSIILFWGLVAIGGLALVVVILTSSRLKRIKRDAVYSTLKEQITKTFTS